MSTREQELEAVLRKALEGHCLDSDVEWVVDLKDRARVLLCKRSHEKLGPDGCPGCGFGYQERPEPKSDLRFGSQEGTAATRVAWYGLTKRDIR